MNDPVSSREERLYAALLRLYPRAFQESFSADMREFFRDRLHAARSARTGWYPFVFWLRIVGDLLVSATGERVSALFDALVRTSPSPARVHSGDSMLTTVAYDLRYTVRTLRRSPVFTIVALLVIALGSGAVTTIFSAANSLILRPLPGTTNPGELIDIQRTNKDGTGSSSLSASYPYFMALRAGTQSLSGLAAWSMVSLTVSRGQEGATSLGNIVSGNYFDVMGVRPALGRFFSPDEDRTPGVHPVVVLSHGFWTRRFAGDSAIVGQSLRINGHPFTVIGVAAPGFRGVYTPLNTDVWVPLMMQQVVRPGESLSTNGGTSVEMVGRVRAGQSHEAVRADLSRVTEQHARSSEPAFHQAFTGVRIATLYGMPTGAKGPIFGFAALLLGISGLVLLIASANVAGMLLARAAARRREIAMRVALGAARSRIVRQLLTESLLLFLLGGIGGLVVAYAGARALEQVPLPTDVPILLDLTPDVRVLAFTLTVSLLTGLLFGLAPAMASARADVTSQLRRDMADSVTRRSRMRSTLVVGQLALSLLLLVSAGLFVRAFDRGLQVNPGFTTENVMVAAFDARTYGYDEGRSRQFYSQLKERLEARAGVEAVSYARTLPLSGSSSGNVYDIDGASEPTDGNRSSINFAQVDPDYFSAIGIQVLNGRSFVDADAPGSLRVAVVNEMFVRRYWPNREPIGRTFREDSLVYTVVGVVSNSKFSALNEEARPFVYFPIAQSWSSNQNLLVRSTLQPGQVTAMIREGVRAQDTGLPVPHVTSLDAVTSVTLLPQRIAATVSAAFGVLGLGLAAVGLYGIVAYTVSQRTREIGVRIALGATSRNVIGMVLHDGMRLLVIGTIIGLALAAAATRLLSSFLFGVSATDALTFVFVPVLLALVAALASYVPARRAAATDPLEALRAD